jgi:hypothetical protein
MAYNDAKEAGREFANYLKLLDASIHAENNSRALKHAENEAKAFSADFSAGKCHVCGEALSSFNKNEPCLHWLLKPEGFEKRDFPRIAERFSFEQVERFIRRVAKRSKALVSLWSLQRGTRTLNGRSLADKVTTMVMIATPKMQSGRTITFKCGSIKTDTWPMATSIFRFTTQTSKPWKPCARCRTIGRGDFPAFLSMADVFTDDAIGQLARDG